VPDTGSAVLAGISTSTVVKSWLGRLLSTGAIFLRRFFFNSTNTLFGAFMSKIKPQVEIESDITQDDFSKLTDDQQMELLSVTFESLIAKLEESGVDPELVSACLFNCFSERMADLGDRTQYELILEEALEMDWEDITLH
jgi:hypothetical protein